MGFLAPALPWIMQGGAALGSALLSKKSQSSAQSRSPEEQTALTGAQGAASSLQQGGQNLVGQGQRTVNAGLDTISPAAGYWSRLLGGNRASMAQSVAAPRAAITDIYRGAERGLERSNVRGAQRDVAKSELNRNRASQIAGLTTGVQPFAAQQLTGIGTSMADIGGRTTGTGAQMSGQGGELFRNLLGQGSANRRYAREEGEKTGGGIGGFLFDMISGMGNKGIMGGLGKIPTGKIDDIPGLFKGRAMPF